MVTRGDIYYILMATREGISCKQSLSHWFNKSLEFQQHADRYDVTIWGRLPKSTSFTCYIYQSNTSHSVSEIQIRTIISAIYVLWFQHSYNCFPVCSSLSFNGIRIYVLRDKFNKEEEERKCFMCNMACTLLIRRWIGA